jgi:hypothetical protein
VIVSSEGSERDNAKPWPATLRQRLPEPIIRRKLAVNPDSLAATQQKRQFIA